MRWAFNFRLNHFAVGRATHLPDSIWAGPIWLVSHASSYRNCWLFVFEPNTMTTFNPIRIRIKSIHGRSDGCIRRPELQRQADNPCASGGPTGHAMHPRRVVSIRRSSWHLRESAHWRSAMLGLIVLALKSYQISNRKVRFSFRFFSI